MDFSRQENLLELEEGGILSYAMSKVQLQLFVSEIFFLDKKTKEEFFSVETSFEGIFKILCKY